MFVSMSLSSRTYLKRIIHAFSTRTRVGVLALIVLVSSWFVAQLVLADRESNIYIFPSAVSSEGWGNDVQALAQDLSLDAELADFTTENSAYIFFGSVASTTEVVVVPETLSEVPSSEPTVSPIPSVVPQTTPITPEPLPAPADVVTSTNGGGEIPTETPAATPLDIPNPLLPTMTTPEVLASSSAQSARPTGSFGTWIAEAVLGRAALVLAQDVPETSEADPVAPDATPSTSEETASTSASSSEVALSAPSPVSNDPYTVASCVTEGSPCHLMTFVGFGLGSALDTQPLLAATLQLSVAGRGTFSGDVHDRFIVRAYHDGRWEFLGETSVKGEFSNAKRGGYLSYALPDVATWSDLSDLRVVVEYVRQEGDGEESDASVVLDGVWVNAQYSSDTLSGVGADELALSGTNLRSALVAKDAALRDRDRDFLTTPEGEVRTLVHGNEHPDATLVIKTDRETYHALGKTSTYFNVTNTDTEAQVVRLQFHLPTAADGAPGARITKLARFSQNVPYKVSSLKYDAVGYFQRR